MLYRLERSWAEIDEEGTCRFCVGEGHTVGKERWRWSFAENYLLHSILVKQNLPLRGHHEKLDSSDFLNKGNFLELLKLLSQYDPVLKNHLKYAEENPRSTSYLSPQIQNEFISLLASSVRNQLISDILRNKYYGILFDSTPDIAHREQFSEVVRYVDIDFDKKTVQIKESFWVLSNFIPKMQFHSKKSF